MAFIKKRTCRLCKTPKTPDAFAAAELPSPDPLCLACANYNHVESERLEQQEAAKKRTFKEIINDLHGKDVHVHSIAEVYSAVIHEFGTLEAWAKEFKASVDALKTKSPVAYTNALKIIPKLAEKVGDQAAKFRDLDTMSTPDLQKELRKELKVVFGPAMFGEEEGAA